MKPKHDLTGRKFGKLTVVSFAGMKKYAAQGHACWNCQCDCGKTSVVLAGNLLGDRSHSCGCLNDGTGARTHGRSSSCEYRIWVSMIQRCRNPSNPNFKRYGGRGISVCDRWADSFETFFADMGDRPSPKHSIGRIDNSGNYEPGNCRWETADQQANNTRRNRKVEVEGEWLTLAQLAKRLGVSRQAIHQRFKRDRGVPVEVRLPGRGRGRNPAAVMCHVCGDKRAKPFKGVDPALFCSFCCALRYATQAFVNKAKDDALNQAS